MINDTIKHKYISGRAYGYAWADDDYGQRCSVTRTKSSNSNKYYRF